MESIIPERQQDRRTSWMEINKKYPKRLRESVKKHKVVVAQIYMHTKHLDNTKKIEKEDLTRSIGKYVKN